MQFPPHTLAIALEDALRMALRTVVLMWGVLVRLNFVPSNATSRHNHR
jgi:hypothetical protein